MLDTAATEPAVPGWCSSCSWLWRSPGLRRRPGGGTGAADQPGPSAVPRGPGWTPKAGRASPPGGWSRSRDRGAVDLYRAAAGRHYRRLGDALRPGDRHLGPGAFNADDMTRAAVVYLRHCAPVRRPGQPRPGLPAAPGCDVSPDVRGPDAGNVVLWMQPDGTLNPSPTPTEAGPSDSGPPTGWPAPSRPWARKLRSLPRRRPGLAGFLRERLELSLDALGRQVLDPRYGTFQTVDGLRLPAWLIVDGADASSEGGLRPGRLRASRRAGELGSTSGASPTAWPGCRRVTSATGRTGPCCPWARSRSLWHAWGDQMAGSLAAAGRALGRDDWVRVAVGETGRFAPARPGRRRERLAAGADRPGADRLRRRRHPPEPAPDRGRRPPARSPRPCRDRRAWYFGNNPAGVAMYDPATGRPSTASIPTGP